MTIAASGLDGDRYIGDGTNVNFTGNFLITRTSEAVVFAGDNVQSFGTNYTIPVLGNPSFQVVFLVAPAALTVITILRNQPISQPTVYLINEAYQPLKVMGDLDNQTKVSAMLNESMGRKIGFRAKSVFRNRYLPDPETNKFLRWDSNGNLENVVLTQVDEDGVEIVPGLSGDFINVMREYGAMGDGITDDTVEIQNAINAAILNGKIIYFPPGTYKVTSTLNVPSGRLSAMSPHRDAATIHYMPTTGNLFSITTGAGVQFEKISLTGQAGATADYLVHINAAVGSGNFRSTFRDVNFNHHKNGLGFAAANSWTVDNCYFFNQSNVQLQIANTQNDVLGRNLLTNSQFIGNGSTTTGVFHQSGSNFRMSDCYLISLLTGYFMQSAVAGQVGVSSFLSDVQLTQNHFANLTNCIRLDPNLGDFADVHIVNNIIHGKFCIEDIGQAEGTRLYDLTVVGNMIAPITDGIGIRINSFGFVIGNNMIDGGGSLNHFGIIIGDDGEDGIISGNRLQGFTPGVSDIVNNAVAPYGTDIIIVDNGLTPVGSTFSAGASPYAYTAGSRRETLYIVQSSGNFGLTIAGQTIATDLSAVEPITVQLEPNETIHITWVTNAPTIARIRH